MTYSRYNRIATAAIGALALSTVFIGAAVGPATTPASGGAAVYAAANVSGQAKA